jgi:hypothetical protein
MNKKAKKALTDFYFSILWYLKKEYHSKYYKFCKENTEMIKNYLAPLYWGGQNIPNTTLEVIKYIKDLSV